MDTQGTPELPPHYYRDNFLSLCDTVQRQYADLLQPEEASLAAAFRSMDFGSQCLYVRLVSRVGPWFRESRLVYPELGPLGPALDALLESQLALAATELSVPDLGRLYTRPELESMLGPQLPGSRPKDKSGLLSQLDELALAPGTLAELAQAWDGGRVVAPLGREIVDLLQLLFFGNRRQGMTDFVLSDLGVARYYPYKLDPDNRLFPHRAALDEYIGCSFYSDSWYELRDSGDHDGMLDLARDMLSTEVCHETTQPRWHRLCNSVAREMERLGELDTALGLYDQSRRHPARERSARILERSGRLPDALEVCEAIVAAPWCEEEGEAANRILPRLRRKLDGSRSSRRRDDFPRVDLLLSPAEQRVELLAAAHLSKQWLDVRYVENHLMNALFGLAFWEQIFAPLPGCFHNPYQSVPTDMYEPGFRRRREAALGARLEQLATCKLERELSAAYRRYRGYQCRWVNWRRIDENLVTLAAAIIPAGHLLAVWERMLFDPGENRRGFPDLLALGDQPGEYSLIEVKGPGDALQDSQKRWLRFFGQVGIPCSVAWVEWRND